jgi:beta-lactamase class D
MILIVSGFVFEGKESILETTIFNGAIEKSLSSFGGSFMIYDFKNDKYFTSNDSLCNLRYPAYSTFKIASSLIALDMGIAKNESYTIQYDSLKYPLPEWMKENNFFKHWYNDHTIKTALKYSVNWYFNELGEQIGNDNMADYMKKLAYGNQIVSTGPEQAWYNGQLKISPNEQVEFIKNILSLECKGISKHAQRITKKIFPGEIESNYSLYGKTGTGQIADNKYIGWYVGYLESKENTFVYALNIFTDDVNKIPGDKRQEIVKNIFADLGLIDKK